MQHEKAQQPRAALDPHPAGVAVSNGYSAYKEGNKDSIWIKDYTGEETFVGQVRRGKGHLTHHCCVHSALV
jgi:hypothetical protein